MPRKVFTAGEVLAAADVNEFLQDQAVMTFAGTAARGSAIPTPTEGMLTYLADSDSFEFFDGSSFVPMASDPPTLEYLVIGGGASGSRSDPGSGGGGGAGGYRTNKSGQLSGGSVTAELPLPILLGTAYPIIVGAGGASVSGEYSSGNRGNRSVLASVTSQGGGGARGRFGGENSTGGSGGAGSGQNGSAGLGIVAEGQNGGTGVTDSGGGGGGAGAVGVNGSGTTGRAGGAGLSNDISGTAVTRGGGGGGGGSSAGGAGGSGGGGAGATGVASAGSANTGGGGGGSDNNATGAGGSGVILFSVLPTVTATFTGGVTQTNSLVGDRQVYIVTATSTTSETVTFS
jgi:hypothetical protein